jgi:quaternary ammonium compound-resistance protein SugE
MSYKNKTAKLRKSAYLQVDLDAIFFNTNKIDMMNTSFAWLLLFIAGLFETGWVIGLKYSNGFTRFWPSVLTAISMAISVWLLSLSLKVLPVGVAYTVWTGIGAVCSVILGIILFNESRDMLKIIFILLIIIGLVGLKMVK